jgi:hypothetical protein
MRKTTIAVRCLRVALSGFLMAGVVLLPATGAWGQINQCIKGKINSQECWVGLQVSGSSITVTPSDVALYSGTRLSWKRTDTQTDFTVDFDKDDCTPFGGVFHFDQSTQSPTAEELPLSQFERCKYKVTIGNLTVDPQVIVIGAKHRATWGRRHLGEW